MIDAAPMEMLFASPLIIGTCGIVTFGIVTASLSSRSGCGDNCAIACRIASYVACRILISSILSGPIVPSPVATACSMMISYSSSLFAAESFLESLIYNISQSFGRITAPATTGPASGPRPTSSIPQIYVYVSYSFHISLNFPCGSFPSVAYPCVFCGIHQFLHTGAGIRRIFSTNASSASVGVAVSSSLIASIFQPFSCSFGHSSVTFPSFPLRNSSIRSAAALL